MDNVVAPQRGMKNPFNKQRRQRPDRFSPRLGTKRCVLETASLFPPV